MLIKVFYMSEETSFDQGKFTEELRDRLAQPDPEVRNDLDFQRNNHKREAKKLYKLLWVMARRLQGIIDKQRNERLSRVDKNGVTISAEELQRLTIIKTQLVEDTKASYRKISEALGSLTKQLLTLDAEWVATVNINVARARNQLSDDPSFQRFYNLELDAFAEELLGEQQILTEAKQLIANVSDFQARIEAFNLEHGIIITVGNAINPYREGVLESGIPDIMDRPIATERRDISLDLAAILAEQVQYYRDMGLASWADSIANIDLLTLTAEKKEAIEKEVAAGAIPIFMPDKAVQLQTAVAQIKQVCQPVFMVDGEQKRVRDAFFDSGLTALVQSRSAKLVEGVPDRPYICLMKPTQKPEEITCNKTRDQQLIVVHEINHKRQEAKLPPVSDTNLFEYVMLQTIYGHELRKQFDGIGSPQTIRPLDSKTNTRFINMPVTHDETVLVGYFRSGGSSMIFESAENAYSGKSHSGFRLSVRVEV